MSNLIRLAVLFSLAVQGVAQSLDARSGRVFERVVEHGAGGLRSLRGGRVALASSDRIEGAREFVAACGEELGLPPGLDIAWSVRGERPVRLEGRFSFEGEPVLGAAVTLELDVRDRVVAAHTRGFANGASAGPRTLDDGRAFDAAVGALDPEIAWRASSRAPAHAWRSTADGLVPVTSIGLSSADELESFEVEIDARDGNVLAIRSLVRHGVGQLPFFFNKLAFPTGKAQVRAFKNVGASLAGKDKKLTLPNWSLGVPVPHPIAKGALLTAHAEVHDFLGADVIAPNGKFLARANDDALAREFDQANAAFQIERTFAGLRSLLGRTPGTNFAVPVLTDMPTPSPLASFAAIVFDSRVVGVIRLGSFGVEARDATMIAHEYVHAWLFHEEHDFDASPGSPFLHVEEGLADWYATAVHKRSAFGELLAQEVNEILLRDLEGDDTFQLAHSAATAGIGIGAGDEHRMGQFFARTLRDVEHVLGRKGTARLVDQAVPAMPKSPSDYGLGAITIDQAAQVTERATVDAFAALVAAHVAGAGKHLPELLGIGAARGLSETGAFELRFSLVDQPKGRVRIPSRFRRGTDIHKYVFLAPAGLRFSLRLEGKDSSVRPAFKFPPFGGTANALSTEPVQVEGGGRIVKQDGLVAQPIASDFHIVEIDNTADTIGDYELVLDADL